MFAKDNCLIALVQNGRVLSWHLRARRFRPERVTLDAGFMAGLGSQTPARRRRRRTRPTWMVPAVQA